mgnify:CR=1 FL=1
MRSFAYHLLVYIGKYFRALDVDSEKKKSILILEAKDLKKALDTLNEGFLFNGIRHRNALKFYGCYLNEVTFQNDFL